MAKKPKTNIQNFNNNNTKNTRITKISDKKFRKKPGSFYKAMENQKRAFEQKYPEIPKVSPEKYMEPVNFNVCDNIDYEWVLSQVKEQESLKRKPSKKHLWQAVRILIHKIAFYSYSEDFKNADFNFNRIHLFLLKYPNAFKIAKNSKELEDYIKLQDEMYEEVSNYHKALGPIIFQKSESVAKLAESASKWIHKRWAYVPERESKGWPLTIVTPEEYKKSILETWEKFNEKFSKKS